MDGLLSEVTCRPLDNGVQEVEPAEVLLPLELLSHLKICCQVRLDVNASEVLGCLLLPNMMTKSFNEDFLDLVNDEGLSKVNAPFVARWVSPFAGTVQVPSMIEQGGYG